MTNASGRKPGGADVDIRPVDRKAASNDADIAVVTDVHGQLLAACDRLESICDSLPREFSRVDCLEMSMWLDQAFPELLSAEEQALNHICTAAPGLNHATGEVWRRYHRTDLTYAWELAEVLADFARHDQPTDVDVLAYMMRGFFEAVRRHIAYEELLITRPVATDHQNR